MKRFLKGFFVIVACLAVLMASGEMVIEVSEWAEMALRAGLISIAALAMCTVKLLNRGGSQ